jgi:hypothetical protein
MGLHNEWIGLHVEVPLLFKVVADERKRVGTLHVSGATPVLLDVPAYRGRVTQPFCLFFNLGTGPNAQVPDLRAADLN